MESKPFGASPEGLRPILTQADFASAMRERRQELGLTLADLDHLAGFHDGYASHLEQPHTRSGKKSFKLTGMGAIWLQTLGLRLVLAPVEGCTLSALVANDDEPTLGSGKRHSLPAR